MTPASRAMVATQVRRSRSCSQMPRSSELLPISDSGRQPKSRVNLSLTATKQPSRRRAIEAATGLAWKARSKRTRSMRISSATRPAR